MRGSSARLALIVLLAAAWPLAGRAAGDPQAEIAHGHALAIAGDCAACHTAPGGQAYAGGLALATPFGKIVTPNLTPDDATGIGTWNAASFYRAMHRGIAANGMHLYPAFPYPYYTKVTRADSDAIFAYLRTLAPVHHAVDRNTLPFPFNIRLLMVGWNWLFFSPGTFQPDAQRSAVYNRGAYLVDGLGHCGACHTPMNFLGATKQSSYLQGGMLNDWVSPNITNAARVGLAAWSVSDIVAYLKTGRNAHSQASGPMAEVVQDQTSRMPDADLLAIATYLKERGAAAPPAPGVLAAGDARMRAGQAVFQDNCAACHRGNGAGVSGIFPPLAGNQNVQQPNPDTLIHVVLTGVRAAATNGAPTAPAMPSFAWRLSDGQIADVLTYLRNSQGNAAAPVEAGRVAALRKRLSPETIADHQQ